MLPQEVPQWLKQGFVRSVINLGATASKEQITATYDDLVRVWCDPARHFHNIHHVLEMLVLIDELAPEVTDPDALRVAVWFHGVVFSTDEINVYAHNGGEDEAASAKVCSTDLAHLGVPSEQVKYVSGLISGMKKSMPSEQRNTDAVCETAVMNPVIVDQFVLRDAHLGFIAAEPQKYRRYVEHVREEYMDVPAAHFYYARKQIVKHLLARKHLFISPLARKWESAARDNLNAELDRITAELSMVDSGELERLSMDYEETLSSTHASTQQPQFQAQPNSEVASALPDTATELFALSDGVADPHEFDVARSVNIATEDQERVNMPTPEESRLSSLETLDDSLDP